MWFWLLSQEYSCLSLAQPFGTTTHTDAGSHSVTEMPTDTPQQPQRSCRWPLDRILVLCSKLHRRYASAPLREAPRLRATR